MSVRRRKSKKRSSTKDYQEQLNRTTFFLERSLGNGILLVERLREAGLALETHKAHFRHNTADVGWLREVGEKGWIVLMRDLSIGRNPLELNALLDAEVKAFALNRGSLTDEQNATILINAIDEILATITRCDFPFIAKVRLDSTVRIWKKDPKRQKGIQRKRR